MNHFKHQFCTHVLGAPKGQENHVDELAIQRGEENGFEVVRSFWKPTDQELLQLNNGGCVMLVIYGRTHAPLRVGVTHS